MRKILIFGAATIIASSRKHLRSAICAINLRLRYYQNADGICVHKPTAVPHEGATALCRDGLYSYATRGPDICANHGGIAELLRD